MNEKMFEALLETNKDILNLLLDIRDDIRSLRAIEAKVNGEEYSQLQINMGGIEMSDIE